MKKKNARSKLTRSRSRQVNGTSTEQRVQFLLGKGLTKEEIEEVKRRAQALLGSSAVTDSLSSPASGKTEESSSSTTWSQTLQSGATVLAAGVGLSQILSPHPAVRGWWNSMFPSSSNSSGNVREEGGGVEGGTGRLLDKKYGGTSTCSTARRVA